MLAQVQKLPDIQVVGDSPVRAFLYKKNLPFQQENIVDSLPAFLPHALPQMTRGQTLLLKKIPKHFVHVEGNTRFGIDAFYRMHPYSPAVNSIDASVSIKAPVGNLLSNHYRAYADFISDSGDLLRSRIAYLYADGRGLHNEYTGFDAYLYSGDVEVSDLLFKDVVTQLGAYRIWQRNSNQRFEQRGLNFYHQHDIELLSQTLENRLFISMGKLGLHSSISLPVPFLDSSALHLMLDKRHVIPSLGFRWTKVTDFDQLLTISNNPHVVNQDYDENINRYRWISLSQGYPALLPLNLNLSYEALFPLSKDFQLRSLKIENSNRYFVHKAILQSGVNPLIPDLTHTDVASNRTEFSAVFGDDGFNLTQLVFVDLNYLSRFNWIRAGYLPILGIETKAQYQLEKWNLGVALDQHFFSRDHLSNDLPEVIDLSLSSEYQPNQNSSIYLLASNLLNKRRWVYRSLPAQGITVFAGVRHRF